MEWKSQKLNELGFVGRGRSRHRPRDDERLYGGEYPFIQTGDVKATEMYITQYSQTYNEFGLSQSKLWEPTTLCITIAANIAETAILKFQACFPDSIVGFVADPDKSDVRFIKYCFDILKQSMQNISRGTTQDNLSLDKLLTFDFSVPPLPIQHRIASILSAYDDLIENNTRRIAILEEQARMIYQEWFVNFRFPGYENGQMVESEMGLVPEGWEVAKMSSIANIFRGRSYTSDNLDKYGDLPFINLKCIERDGGFRIDGIKWYKGIFRPEQTVQNGDIVIAITDMTQERRIVARAARVPKLGDNSIGVFSMDLIKIQSNTSSNPDYLYSMLRHSNFGNTLKSYANGANVLHLNPEFILSYDCLLPSINLQDTFSKLVRSIFYHCDTLNEINANLRQTRDLLLPKLISGEIDVSTIPYPDEDISSTSIDSQETLVYS